MQAVNFFVFFKNNSFRFVVAMSDLLHNVVRLYMA